MIFATFLFFHATPEKVNWFDQLKKNVFYW